MSCGIMTVYIRLESKNGGGPNGRPPFFEHNIQEWIFRNQYTGFSTLTLSTSWKGARVETILIC